VQRHLELFLAELHVTHRLVDRLPRNLGCLAPKLHVCLHRLRLHPLAEPRAARLDLLFADTKLFF